jgi:predicted O-linked N-acetylglucosamine transferase (SPINDLY family)
MKNLRHLIRAFGFAAHYQRRGKSLLQQKRPETAIAWFDRAEAFDPWNPEIPYQRGNARMALGQPLAAIADYTLALKCRPDYVDGHYNRALALQQLGRYEEALAGYERVLETKPTDAEALNNRGNVLHELKRYAEALASYEGALSVRPDYVDALYNRAVTLMFLIRPADAVAAYRQLLRVAPDYEYAKGRLLQVSMISCDWSRFNELVEAIERDIAAGKPCIEPFAYLAVAASAQSQRRCAEIYGKKFDTSPLPSLPMPRRANGKIRVGYVAGEFRHHATGFLMVELFELHDRNRFELFAFDKGGDDGSTVRQRINRAIDEIIDIRGMDDQAAAAAIRARDIDLLVDLNGFVGVAQPGLFALHPAPVVINFLGSPGTMGMPCYDYIIADRVVIPPQHEAHYSEKVVCLPDSYQVNDSKRRLAEHTPGRGECGLPEAAFVFCCFNNNYKITPPVFDIWMRLLAKIDGSVLWLLEDNPDASFNLRREAVARGVLAARLVFAPRMEIERHLARHRLADLFLDTLPCNAHTTASDALWAGLPLLTCLGPAFPGRVAASVLTAAGLPELITHDLAGYEARAIELATSPAMLAELRDRLERNRTTCALFDTVRYCRHLEAAYTMIWERHLRGEAPRAFTVSVLQA